MKAAILIDMPDEVSLDEWYAVEVTVDRLKATEEEMLKGIPFDESKTFKFVPLRPLPRKLDANDWHRMFGGLFSEREAKGYGWNACLDAITGETK